MLCGGVSVFCDSHWLVCFGLGNALNGIACLYIGVGKTLSRLGKKMYISYGGKTTLMGALFCLLNFLLEGMVSTGNIFAVKAIAMGVLLIYGYKVHLTDEFMYVHLEGLFSTNRCFMK